MPVIELLCDLNLTNLFAQVTKVVEVGKDKIDPRVEHDAEFDSGVIVAHLYHSSASHGVPGSYKFFSINLCIIMVKFQSLLEEFGVEDICDYFADFSCTLGATIVPMLTLFLEFVFPEHCFVGYSTIRVERLS